MARVKDTDRGWKRIQRELKKYASGEVKVGLQGKKGEARHTDSDKSVAYIGAVHEFGYPAGNIPSRSFLRSTMDDHQKAIARKIKAEGITIIDGSTALAALSRVGAFMVRLVKKKIRGRIKPGLKSATITARRAKGIRGTVPLLATRQLINAISYSVSIAGQVVKVQ